MKSWLKFVRAKIKRRYQHYKLMRPFNKLLFQLRFILFKLQLRIYFEKLVLWRHFPLAIGLVGGVIYCSFTSFRYLPACIMGLCFAEWYEYYKHPDISKLKSGFVLMFLILVYIAITIIMIGPKL